MDARMNAEKKMKLQKRRRSSGLVLITKRVLMCAVCGVVSGIFLLIHAPRVFPIASEESFATSIVIRETLMTGNQRKWTTPPISFLSRELMDAKGDSDWKLPPNSGFSPCFERGSNFTPPGETRGYLVVQTNGGLNQMRAGICDMVAVARIINATLVVPEMDKNSFWLDSSNFSDIFDEDHFISSLSADIRLVKSLPKSTRSSPKIVRSFKSWSGMEYYKHEISNLYENYSVIRAAKSDSRLANNNLPLEIQKLRCRACYDSLRFAPRIEAMGKILVERMRSYGPYISLHLRYEKDVLAFSGCTYGLSSGEARELRKIRETTPHWKVKKIDPTSERSKGLCPMTPKEVAVFLAGVGYPATTPIYIAAGRIYGGEPRLADLRSRFPVLLNKESLATREELAAFAGHESQMAAVDYIVSIESDVFVPTYNGNMARAVAGHRRVLGHRKTILPDRKEIVRLYDKATRGPLNDGSLSRRMTEIHRTRQGWPRKRRGPKTGKKGMERFRSEETFYENPFPDCSCQKQDVQLSTLNL